MSHATTTIKIEGYSGEIDTAILPLIELINNIKDIQTFTCCEGYFDGSDDLFPLGYVIADYFADQAVAQLDASMKDTDLINADALHE
jgi:hypothetical protein